MWKRRSTPTNVFVLGTGRCGTTTFIRACDHLDNFTAGHETRADRHGPERFTYPDRHIEADNRLTWFLGDLGRRFDGRDVLYVHLRRDPDAVVESFLGRFASSNRASIIRAFSHGMVMRGRDYTGDERREVCRFYVDAVTANIEQFLEDRPSMTMWLEEGAARFPRFLDLIHATGDLEAATAEWQVKHNARNQPGSSVPSAPLPEPAHEPWRDPEEG